MIKELFYSKLTVKLSEVNIEKTNNLIAAHFAAIRGFIHRNAEVKWSSYSGNTSLKSIFR